MPNYLYSICWVSNVVLDGRANTAATLTGLILNCQAQPAVARLQVCTRITTRFKLVPRWQPELSVWKTKGARTGTVALLNSPADSEATCSGAAAAGWPGLVRHCCSVHSANEFNYDFLLKLLWNHDIPHDILHYILQTLLYNFFHEKVPKFMIFSLNAWKIMNWVYQEVYWQRIHINVHIRTHGKSWIHVWEHMTSSVPRSLLSKNSYQ